MEKARFMSQYRFRYDFFSIDYAHVMYSNHLGGWRRYSWAGGDGIVGHFWILATNKATSVCIQISPRKSTNLLPQAFKQFCKV
jgi:hypothetical protein